MAAPKANPTATGENAAGGASDLAKAVAAAIGKTIPKVETAATNNPPPTEIDYNSYFKQWSLPADVSARVQQFLQADAQNPKRASDAALNYVRGTTWYAQTYPGIQVAEAKGLVNNEADYRALLNQQTQIYQQYLGRHITSDEFAANLNEGVSSSMIGQRLQGAAVAKTYGGDWSALLGAYGTGTPPTKAGLTALGNEKAGLDTPMGQLMQKRLDLAQQRMTGVFKGTLATPSLSLNGGRLVGQQAGAKPDIAA